MTNPDERAEAVYVAMDPNLRYCVGNKTSRYHCGRVFDVRDHSFKMWDIYKYGPVCCQECFAKNGQP